MTIDTRSKDDLSPKDNGKALFCVSYRAEHYDDLPPYSLGCEFVEAYVPVTKADGEAIAEAAVQAVRDKRANAPLNQQVKDVWITGVQRLSGMP